MRFLTRFSSRAAVLAVIIGAASAALTQAADTTAPATATAPANTTISGKVVDKDGNAVSGAVVSVLKFTADAGKKAGKKSQTGDATGATPKKVEPLAKTVTDKDGAFTLKDVPAEKVNVIAQLKGKGRGKAGPFEVTAGQNTDAGTITLAAPKAKKAGADTPAATSMP